ncbi:MAG TPA: hypothetical protein PLB89_04790 [Flavobacteriales bacterium]|nr:hypothetical protein [Flavobacteriales bacterium]
MTFLYLLGTDSKWENNELRYSLRSICRHVQHDQVIVVGERPSWLRNVTHIAVPDVYPTPVGCQLHKLLQACSDPAVPDRFTLMNDDFLFLEDHAIPLATYIRGTIEQRISDGPRFEAFYYELMIKALHQLRKLGIAQPLDFDSHHPLPMIKSRVLAMAELFGGSGSVYQWRTMYGNTNPVITTYQRDPKVYVWAGEPRVPFISTGPDLERSSEFVRWIAERFPEPCIYEA